MKKAQMKFMLLITGLLASTMSLAEYGLNLRKGVTEFSETAYEMHTFTLWICIVIGIVVFGAMIYSIFAHRKSKGYQPEQFSHSTTAEVIWTIIPILILVVIAIPATRALIQMENPTTEDGSRLPMEMTIKVTGYQWKWQYEYLGQDVSFMSELATPESEIYNTAPKSQYYVQEVSEPLVIPANTKVRFLITAKDVIHSWWLPDLGVKKDAIPGLVNETWAYVNEPGIYRGACTELCGQGHAFMPVVVNVLEKEAYNSWLAEKKEAAAAERELSKKTFTMDELMAQGKEAYDRSCAACHQVNGQGIAGVFPSMIGGAITTGDITSHIDIVVNGKAGTSMQAFGGQLSEVDIAAIVTYERNAWGNNTGDVVQPIDILKHKQGQ